MDFHNELDEVIHKCRFQLKITLLQGQMSEGMTVILIKLEQLPHYYILLEESAFMTCVNTT